MIERSLKFVLSPEFLVGMCISYVVLRRQPVKCPQCENEFRRIPRLTDQFENATQHVVDRTVNGVQSAFTQRVGQAIDAQSRSLAHSVIPWRPQSAARPKTLTITPEMFGDG